MANFKWFASLVLAATIVHTLPAEIHCPGSAASVPLRLVNRYQMIVSVFLNKSGPYDFLLDTGTEMTMIDVSLANALHLETHGAAVVAGAGLQVAAAFSQLDELAVGTDTVANPKVLVYDLHSLQSTNRTVVGILGEDFLEHFDVLIDNAHKSLCLDDTGAMRAGVKGIRVPLLAQAQVTGGVPLPYPLIIAVRLSDGKRPVRLKLDSGANAPFLYNTSQYMAFGLARGKSWYGGGVDGKQQTFSALPPQNMKVGSLEMPGVLFVTLVGVQKDSSTTEFDGLLSTGLFKRVFIGHTDHTAVLDAW
jgi:hypothetical protein